LKTKVVIIGAGLGGSFLASELAEAFDVTVIEIGNQSQQLSDRINDVGVLAVTNPHIMSGFGGTTKVWHNGLKEIFFYVLSIIFLVN
jgi:choline dehydrogenase-like flavoprotein